AGDPREGNAPPADRWFLIEHPGPWGRVALSQSGLGAAAVRSLSAWEATSGGRVLLVRRPGRGARTGPSRWFRVDSRPGHESVRTGTFTADSDLTAAVYAPGERWSGPLYVVCAHGRHDTCCAVRGRPLAAALAEVEPDRVWEGSHIGGCRFAPALVLLPHGFALGGVPPHAAAEVAADYRAGRLDPQWVRGRSSQAPAAQAAQHHARLATGAVGVDALGVVEVSRLPSGDRWEVQLTAPGCTVLLHERRVVVDRPLTCASSAPARMRVFDLVDLQLAAPLPASPA
ncbi:MAG TPA: sucrase ferredoxin, partial [Pseudonocardia sp.]|nr:sucrase ferredoxin [Pseudonocardia sp.]